MLFTIFCCISTGLSLYCILNRFNRRTIDLRVHAAVHEVKKEMHERHSTLLAQMASKDRELKRMREMLKLHEVVPSTMVPGTLATTAGGAPAPGAKPAKKKAKEGYELFEMSQPFTETTYNALLRATDVVKVEPAAM